MNFLQNVNFGAISGFSAPWLTWYTDCHHKMYKAVQPNAKNTVWSFRRPLGDPGDGRCSCPGCVESRYHCSYALKRMVWNIVAHLRSVAKWSRSCKSPLSFLRTQYYKEAICLALIPTHTWKGGVAVSRVHNESFSWTVASLFPLFLLLFSRKKREKL